MASTKQTISIERLSTFGARLRHEREAQGLSRPALSKLTGGTITARVIDHLESGTSDVTAQRAEVLSEALNVDRNWLMFGEPVNLEEKEGTPEGTPSITMNDAPVNTGSDTSTTGSTGQNRIEIRDQTGFNRDEPESIKPVETEIDVEEIKPVEPVEPVEPVFFNRSRKYIDELQDILSFIDMLRADGLQNHPRKMPKLIKQAIEIGEFLELSDLKELAIERGIQTPEDAEDEFTEIKFDELVLRLIDTAILGIDLCELDMDTLNAFRRKHTEVSTPLFGWKDNNDIVRRTREAYWEKALQGKISIQTSLRHG